MSSSPICRRPLKNNTRRLLLLNWRDPWHPKAGGAELLTLRICERLAQRGWAVVWFTARYRGAPKGETRDGVHYVRAGSQTTVHWHAFARYRRARNFDCVVEEINTVPFFTPLYLRAPKAAFFCQLAREVWHYEAAPGLRSIGYLAEPFYLKVYRHMPLVAISESTATSLREVGLRGHCSLIPIAVDEVAVDRAPADPAPYGVVVVARLTPSKRIEHCILAAQALAGLGWSGNLHIVGDGKPNYVESLRALARRVLGERVVFHGRVSDELRRALLGEVAVLWATSVREGWGLVVTEAARHGKPAIVYDVPGLRDAVRDGVTGFVVSPRPQDLANATLELFGPKYAEFSGHALRDSKQYSWDRTADAFEAALVQTIDRWKGSGAH